MYFYKFYPMRNTSIVASARALGKVSKLPSFVHRGSTGKVTTTAVVTELGNFSLSLLIVILSINFSGCGISKSRSKTPSS